MSQGMSENALEKLAATIKARRAASAEDSYTKRLLDEAPAKPAQKLGEEAVEVVVAALVEGRQALVGETADLLYHLLVVLESRDVTLDDVYGELERRMESTANGQEKGKPASV